MCNRVPCFNPMPGFSNPFRSESESSFQQSPKIKSLRPSPQIQGCLSCQCNECFTASDNSFVGRNWFQNRAPVRNKDTKAQPGRTGGSPSPDVGPEKLRRTCRKEIPSLHSTGVCLSDCSRRHKQHITRDRDIPTADWRRPRWSHLAG
jgi:hypothetical protein